jgi:hypothetical protein
MKNKTKTKNNKNPESKSKVRIENKKPLIKNPKMFDSFKALLSLQQYDLTSEYSIESYFATVRGLKEFLSIIAFIKKSKLLKKGKKILICTEDLYIRDLIKVYKGQLDIFPYLQVYDGTVPIPENREFLFCIYIGPGQNKLIQKLISKRIYIFNLFTSNHNLHKTSGYYCVSRDLHTIKELTWFLAFIDNSLSDGKIYESGVKNNEID